MRILVTGGKGFVGTHLCAMLRARGHDVVVADHADHAERADTLPVDVTDRLAVRAAFDLVRPDAVAHLAAQSSPADAFDDPAGTFVTNALGTLHVLEAARALGEDGARARVLVASSADVYGVQPPDAYPVRETHAARPRNAYAASKAAAEALASSYARSYDVDVVVTRAFNHIGPGQDERFAVAAFAAEIARVATHQQPVVFVGNLDASRDIVDVRDVCEAYALLLEGGGSAGEIYNVCSGRATSMRDVLRELITIAHVPIEVREDPERVRPADVPMSVGDAAKLREATGWVPRIPLRAALRSVYEDALERAVRAESTPVARGT